MAEIEKSIYFRGKIIPSAIQISQTQGPICVTPLLKSFSVNILSPFLILGPFSSATPKGCKKNLDFQMQNFMLNLLKKKSFKNIKYCKSSPDPEYSQCGYHLISFRFFPISGHFRTTQENQNQSSQSRKN